MVKEGGGVDAVLLVALHTSGGRGCRAMNMRKATALKITLDSSEPLEDAIRVVGALYGVTLVVFSDEQDGTKPAKEAAKPVRKTAMARKRATAVKSTRTRRPTKTDGRRAKDAAARRSAGSPSNAEVRSWARQNGLTVSDRGRVPAAVLAAYRRATNE
jgi:Lsr2